MSRIGHFALFALALGAACGDVTQPLEPTERCEAGEHVRNHACVACPDGTIREGGDPAEGPDTTCKAVPRCAEDERVLDGQCLSCPEGQSNDAGDDPSGPDTDCEPPPPPPEACLADHRVEAGACVPCSDGLTNEAGDDPGGPDTMCDPRLEPCRERRHVEAGRCVPCPNGTYNEAGDDPYGPDTSCEPINYCLEDERVEAGVCVPCPDGYTNEAGDDPTRSDTVCNRPGFCAEDERVENGACVPCQDDLRNEAGDDPLGPDTACHDLCTHVLGVDCETFEDAYLKSDAPEAWATFGSALALSADGNTLAVGAFGQDGPLPTDPDVYPPYNSGAVYLFTRTATSWVLEAELEPEAPVAGDNFGFAVALDRDGDTLAVGARFMESAGPGGLGQAGAVFVYARTGAGWSLGARVEPSLPEAGSRFGSAVALSDDGTLLVASAPFEDSLARDSGAAFVFAQVGPGWSEQAKLKASNAGETDWFGEALALDAAGDTLVVGSRRERSNATTIDGDQTDDSASMRGAAYVFVRAGTSWSQQAYLKAPDHYEAWFSTAIALSSDGDQLAVSCPVVGGTHGLIYLFERNGNQWSRGPTLAARNNRELGTSLVMSGDGNTLVAAAEYEESGATGLDGDREDTSAFGAGAVFVFRRDPVGWAPAVYLKASNTDEMDWFGHSLAVSDDGRTLAIGAILEDGASAGVDGDQSDNSVEAAGAVYVRQIAP
ncbi:MAG: hypothetical protein H6730_22640 [Deltaproteobacteria bacterium]|nr:hypothetical protein [Deltaproteobacteria bacterium]